MWNTLAAVEQFALTLWTGHQLRTISVTIKNNSTWDLLEILLLIKTSDSFSFRGICYKLIDAKTTLMMASIFDICKA